MWLRIDARNLCPHLLRILLHPLASVNCLCERCISCRTCVPSGWKFHATKAAMTAFFMISPPTCKTYLTTDFDDPAAQTVVFEKPETKDGVHASRALAMFRSGISVARPKPQARCANATLRRQMIATRAVNVCIRFTLARLGASSGEVLSVVDPGCWNGGTRARRGGSHRCTGDGVAKLGFQSAPPDAFSVADLDLWVRRRPERARHGWLRL